MKFVLSSTLRGRCWCCNSVSRISLFQSTCVKAFSGKYSSLYISWKIHSVGHNKGKRSGDTEFCLTKENLHMWANWHNYKVWRHLHKYPYTTCTSSECIHILLKEVFLLEASQDVFTKQMDFHLCHCFSVFSSANSTYKDMFYVLILARKRFLNQC